MTDISSIICSIIGHVRYSSSYSSMSVSFKELIVATSQRHRRKNQAINSIVFQHGNYHSYFWMEHSTLAKFSHQNHQNVWRILVTFEFGICQRRCLSGLGILWIPSCPVYNLNDDLVVFLNNFIFSFQKKYSFNFFIVSYFFF